MEFLGSRVGAAVLSMATFIVVTRTTPVDVAGVYISAVSYGVLLYGLLDLGTGPNLVRTAVHGDYRARVTEYVWTRAALTAAVVALGAIGVVILFPSEAQPAGFASLIFVASSMNAVAGPIGQVIGDATVYRTLTLAQGVMVFAAVAVVAIVVPDPTALELVLAFSIGGLLTSLAAIFWVRNHLAPIPIRSVPSAINTQIRAVAILAFATGAGSIYLRIDQALVLNIAGAASAAFYGIASRIAVQARLVPSAMQLSLSTLLADRLRKSDGLRPHESSLTARIAMNTGVALSLSVIALSDLGVWVLGGRSYEDAVNPTIILAVSLVATSYSYVVGTAVVMSGRDLKYLRIMLLAVVVNIGANLALIGPYGINAAAAVATATEVLTVLLLAALAGRRGGAVAASRFVFALVAALAAAGVKLLLMEAPLWGNIVGSALLCLVALAVFRPGYDALRRLPAIATPAEVEVSDIAAERI